MLTKLSYLHEAPDVLLFLQEVLVESAPMGHQLQYLTLPEEGVFALLLAPAASAAISESSQGDKHNVCVCVRVCIWQ